MDSLLFCFSLALERYILKKGSEETVYFPVMYGKNARMPFLRRVSPSSSLAEDTALSRRKHGFESRWGRSA